MGKLKIGLYEQDITPNGKLLIPGQFYRRVSDEIESRLKVNIFVCETDDEQLILAAADLTHMRCGLVEAVRERVKKKCDIPDTMKIILSATHTHTAFEYCQDIFDSSVNKFFPSDFIYKAAEDSDDFVSQEECFLFLAEQISDGIAKAWKKRKNAYIGEEFGRAVVGHSRRVVYTDNTAKMYGISDKSTFLELESGSDSGVELLYVFDENKKPIGAVVNVSCPAQVLEHKSFISADYWGKVREFTKKEFGEDFVIVGLCGAAGCQSPRDMIRFVLPNTKDPNLVRDNEQRPRRTDPDMYDVEGAIELGHRIADVVLRKVSSAKENARDYAVLLHDASNVLLPLRKVTETDCTKAKENIKKYIERMPKKEFDGYDKAAIHTDVGVIDRYLLQETQEMIEVELHVARLGDVAFASYPFELFLDYGNKIRARSHAKQTFLIELACGEYGYLPTEKAQRGSHYSAYVASGYVGYQGGNILVDRTFEKIKKQFSE